MKLENAERFLTEINLTTMALQIDFRFTPPPLIRISAIIPNLHMRTLQNVSQTNAFYEKSVGGITLFYFHIIWKYWHPAKKKNEFEIRPDLGCATIETSRNGFRQSVV